MSPQRPRALRAAVGQLAAASGTASTLLDEQSRLLRSALAVHAQHGDMPCPVCGVGTLDADWAKRSSTLLAEQKPVWPNSARVRQREQPRVARPTR